MDFIRQSLIDPVSRFLWNYVLVYVLIGAGLYFTVRTRFVQFRHFPQMLSVLRGARGGAGGEAVSPFQAFCVGLASRVGTGNIAGVAIALTLGGPGAIFWMWVVGLIGMATAFVESSLAQLFKVRGPDGAFRGGPATYIQRGLGSRAGGSLFAVLLIFTFGIAFNMVQANTIADVVSTVHAEGQHWVALALMVATAPVLFGGIHRIARVAEVVVPLMALVYVALALLIVLLNIGEVPAMISQIIRGAFGLDPALAGIAGGLSAALLNGAKRGLFSNEAGMGSAPNAAATATTDHPAKQGLLQSFGVFVDTILICTATAFIIMLGGDHVYQPGQASANTGASLTQAAVASQFGGWTTWLMIVLVSVFAYSSILGNYAYAEVNLDFLGAGRILLTVFRIFVIAIIGLGSLLALDLVWEFADVAMALMALVNLVAIVLLGRWAFGVLSDYEKAMRARRAPVFIATDNPELPRPLVTDVWP